jgi:hypothetical protein
MPPFSDDMPWKVLLGTNRIIDCDAALVVEGEEVFRLREHNRDGNLVIDFDVRAADGSRIAKIAKNYVAYLAPDYEFRRRTGFVAVINEPTGQVVARAELRGPDTVAITGTFHVNGYAVLITPTYLKASGVTTAGNEIRGYGKAIELNSGSTGIGV